MLPTCSGSPRPTRRSGLTSRVGCIGVDIDIPSARYVSVGRFGKPGRDRMKLARYDAGAGTRAGVVREDGLVDLAPLGYGDLLSIIRDGEAALARIDRKSTRLNSSH